MILAHGIGGRTDLPIPLSSLLAGGATVLVVSFLALAVMWPRPRLQDGLRRGSRSVRVPLGGLLATLGVLGLFLVIAQVLIPITGGSRLFTRPTIAPVLVWVVFWLVVPLGSALVGNWYADLNPWRTLAGAFGIGRMERVGLTETLGLWPASGVFLAFIWLELVSPDPGDPVVLGMAALVYTVALLIAMAAVGRETGLAVFDAFTPYNRLISAISPIGRDADGRLHWRGWLRALAALPERRGLWFFVVAMIATVSFDGASETDWFTGVTGGLGQTLGGETLLLLATVALFAGLYLGASAIAGRLAGTGHSAVGVAQSFAHTLVPIALAYALAHYFTLVIFEGQQLFSAISDPFGLGWDLFGSANRRIDFFVTTSTPIWLLQVAFIVGGHLVGVVLAHDRSLHDFGPGAVRSQYAMLVLMIALSSLGLLILST